MTTPIPQPPDPHLPEDLRRDLRALYTPSARIPADRDAAILSAAHGSLRATPRGRWRMAVGTGLAAAVAIAATLYWATPRHEAATLTASHTGDIRDAYTLARQLKSASDGEKNPLDTRYVPAWWDANHDGRVDESDVDALALAVVQLTTPMPNGGMR